MDSGEHLLRGFERTLEDLIGLLESDGAGAEALSLATGRCVEACEQVRAHERTLLGADPEQLRRGRDRVRRLHALARSAAAAAVDSTAQRVERARDARRTLANLRAESATGTACDLKG